MLVRLSLALKWVDSSLRLIRCVPLARLTAWLSAEPWGHGYAARGVNAAAHTHLNALWAEVD